MSIREAVRHRSCPVPAALLGFSLVAIAGGTLSLIQLVGGSTRRAASAGTTS